MSNKLVGKKDAGRRGFWGKLSGYTFNVLDVVTCLYMLFVIVLLPVYNKGNYDRIGSEKIQLLWNVARPCAVIVLALGGVYLVCSLVYRGQRNGWKAGTLPSLREISFSVTDWFALGYGAAVLLSYLCSDYHAEAFMGYERWGMGLVIQLVFVAGYFCISRAWKRRDWVLAAMFPVTAVVFVLGCLNRFGVDPLGMNTIHNPLFISLTGNINWYCGYMVMPVAASVCFAWGMRWKAQRLRLLMDVFLVICFGAVLLNGSASGIWTIFIVLLWLFMLSVRDLESLGMYCRLIFLFLCACLISLLIRLLFPEAINYTDGIIDLLTYSFVPFVMLAAAAALYGAVRYWQRGKKYPAVGMKVFARVVLGMVVVGISLFVGLIVVNTLHPGSIGPLSDVGVFTFADEWGSLRGATWKAGVMLYGELPPFKKLIGIGPDCMVYYLQRGAGQELKDYVERIWPTANLTNAHCEALTVLIQNGILGLLSFGGLLVSAIYRYLHQFRAGDKNSCIVAACGMALAAYAAHNIFSFQQVLNGPTMFLVLGVGEAYFRGELERKKRNEDLKKRDAGSEGKKDEMKKNGNTKKGKGKSKGKR